MKNKQKENVKTMQGEYSQFLNNQMKEKEYTQNIWNQEKRSFQENMRIKTQIQEQKTKMQERERLESQTAYRNVLNHQQRFKNEHPESSLKVNEPMQKPMVVPIVSEQRHMSNPEVEYLANSSPGKISQASSYGVDINGQISANQGIRSNYVGPNPILAPISDPLYNPYVRKEVNNSIHAPKKRNIYIPPDSIAF